TAIATKAMRALPVGVPKLMVSTMAAGNTRDYIGASDIALMASVTDIAGINSISARILANAAAAMAGMVNAPPVELGAHRPLIAATMFGVTTPSVTAAREELERRGYEVLTFHATGTGGRAMEALAESGFVTGVRGITTTVRAGGAVHSAPRSFCDLRGGRPLLRRRCGQGLVQRAARERGEERRDARGRRTHQRPRVRPRDGGQAR